MLSLALKKALRPKSMFSRLKAIALNVLGVTLISPGFEIGQQIAGQYFIHFLIGDSVHATDFLDIVFT